MRSDADRREKQELKRSFAAVDESIDEIRQVMMMCVDADRKTALLLRQVNDRLSVIERTINTFIYGDGFEARKPSTYSVKDEIEDESGEISDDDVQQLLRRSRPAPQQSEVKMMTNSDGSQVYRFKYPGNRWVVIKLDKFGDMREAPFMEDINGTRDEIDHDTAAGLLAGHAIYIPRRPMGSDPDPNAMDVTMNPEED